MDIAALTYCYLAFNFLDAIIGIQLETMGLDGARIGLVFSGMTLAYTLTNFFLAYISRGRAIGGLVNASLAICSAALLVIGPAAHYLGEVWICVAGVMILGIGTAAGFCGVLPSVISDLEKIRVVDEADKEKVSSIFTFGVGLGEVAGPIVSGGLMAIADFSGSCAILAVAGLGLMIMSWKVKIRYDSKSVPLLGEKQ